MRKRWRTTCRAVHLPPYHRLMQLQPKMSSSRKCVLLATFLQVVVFSMASQPECTRDSDCGNSFYCTGGICERCIPCQQLLNRQASPEPRGCAKTETACGSCLKGYQAEELTNQRYSLKCYPVTFEEEKQSFTNSDSPNNPSVWYWDLILVVASVAIAIMTVAIIVFVACRRKFVRRSEATCTDEEKGQDEMLVGHQNPPPYAPSAPSYQDVAWTNRVVVEREVNVQATPIGRYHMEHYDLDNSDEQGDVLDNGNFHDRPADSDSESVGSTETIPSLWEPGSTPNLSESRPVPVPQVNANGSCSNTSRPRLRRSTSLDLHERRNRIRPNLSRSDDIVAHRCTGDDFAGIYSGVHVKLASQRTLNEATDGNSTISAEDGYNSEVEAFVVDPCRYLFGSDSVEGEPEPPQPFTFAEQLGEDQRPFRPLFRSLSATSQAHGGSEDSGIYEAANRRRPLPSDVIEFSFRLSVKRLREDPQSK